MALGSLDLSKEFIVSEIRGAPVTAPRRTESRLLGTFPQGAAVVVEEVVLLSSGSARARISTCSLGDGWVSCGASGVSKYWCSRPRRRRPL